MKKNLFGSSGKISAILLILGAMLIVIAIIVFILIRINTAKNSVTPTDNTTTPQVTEEPKPVYEVQIGDVKFTFQSAENRGNVLSNRTNSQTMTTTEKFIQVTIGAQNKGKANLSQGSWDVGNIIDSEGRNFISINNVAYSYLPSKNPCQALLKPEFEPTPCVKLYEVSRASTGLKVQVYASSGASSKKGELLDLIVK